ncbi:hypothetical protein BD31_I0755 [Candidatus Nitrosopumilus salaria BD31]|uniref:Uncharacterized protein n=1 Tax=Candidatus Nitrosopumilus salarius BD31 TaxID=859350 RepID=I3CZU2_9ARCH|nr:hypothetical protein [Candidatus Nitrosopumilus salaria]EIJ64985.1 hypothetical protein BD31_I0755 [Candidatus Nitrosopumilus salaria BD31]
MNNYAIEKLTSERIAFPNVDTLLKISLGLILFTIISFALVYAETIPVDVDGTTYDVEYTATGMTVSSIEADLDFVSLILTVDVTDSSGTLDITLDRAFFDSTFDGFDDDFIVLVDGDEPSFTETENTSQSRTLSIELPSGTEEIEIIGSVFGSPAVEEPAVEEPAVEEPAVEEPAVEEPAVEEPVVTPPKVEEKPVVTPPKVQCGPGTVLKDGACVLDQSCGPGTVLKDGVCVLDSTPKPTQTSVKGMGKELVMGVVAAFVVAGTVGLILGIMSKASKSS